MIALAELEMFVIVWEQAWSLDLCACTWQGKSVMRHDSESDSNLESHDIIAAAEPELQDCQSVSQDCDRGFNQCTRIQFRFISHRHLLNG